LINEEEALPEYRNGQPDSPFRLWNCHDGVVYAARTDDGGTSWHGYPAVNPPRRVERELLARATKQGYSNELKRWLKQKI
jgi:hypothetical protein